MLENSIASSLSRINKKLYIWGTETSDQRVVNGSRSKFLRDLKRRPMSQNHRKPSILGQREYLWTSYLEAEDPGRSTEAKRVETQNWTAETGQTGCTDRSDRSGWEFKFQTGQTGRSQIARQQSSKCQILSKRSPNSMKLEGKLL